MAPRQLDLLVFKCTLSPRRFRSPWTPYDFSDVHESDDSTKDPIAMDVYASTGTVDLCGSFVTVPGTELGAGQRVNLNRPSSRWLNIYPVLTQGQWVDISEVRA